MDPRLDRAWRVSQTPFNGDTVFLSDPIPTADLVALLRQVTAFLKRQYPNAALRKLEDWHEHDGVVLESDDIDWMYLDRLLQSADSFRQAVSDDDDVCLGIYDSACQFYLRFGFSRARERETGRPTDGDFDLSGASDLCRAIRSVADTASTCIVPAKRYFDERYAGDDAIDTEPGSN